jgi:hypothetical protein
MDQLSLENFENNRIELLFCQNTLISSFCQQLASCGEKCWLWEKGGVFEILNQFLLERLSSCLNNCVWLRDRNLSLICKNKPSGGKEWSIYAKNESKQFWVLICIDIALVLVALYCVGINHQKGEIEREMCPWAISKYFGDWVPTQVLLCWSMQYGGQSANHV